jgi:hypothetical protein
MDPDGASVHLCLQSATHAIWRAHMLPLTVVEARNIAGNLIHTDQTEIHYTHSI